MRSGVIDIVVTIPKSEYKNDDLETEFFMSNKDAYQFWALSKVPKNLEIGDRVYFVKYNKIDSSMKIFDINFDSKISEKCELTVRVWDVSCILYLNDLRDEKLGIKIKGFQGFRYKWWG